MTVFTGARPVAPVASVASVAPATRVMRAVLAMLVVVLALCPCAAMAQKALVDNGSAAGGKLNMRMEPSRDSTSLGGFYSGTQVEIVADAGSGWSEVSIGSGLGSVSGYMMSDYLATGSAMESVIDATYDMRVVSPYGTQSVVLRSRPSDSYDAVAMLAVGEAVRVIGVSGDFYYVRIDNDAVGCLSSDELK